MDQGSVVQGCCNAKRMGKGVRQVQGILAMLHGLVSIAE